MTYLFFDIFGICMLWGIQNQLRFFLRALLGQQVPQHDVTRYVTYALRYVRVTLRTCYVTNTLRYERVTLHYVTLRYVTSRYVTLHYVTLMDNFLTSRCPDHSEPLLFVTPHGSH
jgi:hypothetical protein